MDMAYTFDQHTTPDSTTNWIKRWSTQQFGNSVATQTVDILDQYGILTARRKYELLSETPFPFSTTNYDEAQNNLAQWEALLDKTQATYDSLDQATRTSFFQLVLHPVMAGKTMVDLYTKVAFNKLYAEQGRVSANFAAEQARALFQQDADITKRYNTLNNGKWNGFVNQAHIGYTSWQEPSSSMMPSLTYTAANASLQGPLGVGIQGTSMSYPRTQTLTLPTMSSHMPDSEDRWIDLFALTNGTIPYSLSTNSSFVKISPSSGTLRSTGNASDARIIITIDWAKAPSGLSSTAIRITSGSTTIPLTLPLKKLTVPSTFKGFIESNGAIAIEAAHYTSSSNPSSYIEISSYGRTLSAMKLWPVTLPSQSPSTSPYLSYNIFTTTSISAAKLVFMFGASHNHDPTRPLRFAYSVDKSSPKEVAYVKSDPVYKENAAWRKAVVENGWTSEVDVGNMVAGAHEVRMWLLEPGVVLQRLAVDVGGLTRVGMMGMGESLRV